MGAERWIELASEKEANRLKAYLGDIEDVGVDGCWCWFQWGGPTRFEVGYSFGGSSRDLAPIVCREIATRFAATRIGADSTEWYEDTDWEEDGWARENYGSYDSWVAWIKDYRKEFSTIYRLFKSRPEDLKRLDEDWEKMEEIVREFFEKLDADSGTVGDVP